MTKKEEKINKLKEEYDRIQEENINLDISKYLATQDDLPELGEIQIYNYEKDELESKHRAEEILNSLVDLYLGDVPNISGHKYIKDKKQEDARVYAETLFLQKMTRKNFISQLRQIDNGDNSARMHEVSNQTINQIRENIKFYQTQRSELEKFYKEIRKDYNEILDSAKDNEEKQEESDANTGKIINSRNLNDMIDDLIKNKKV